MTPNPNLHYNFCGHRIFVVGRGESMRVTGGFDSMKNRLTDRTIVFTALSAAAAVIAVFSLTFTRTASQTRAYRVPRTADGKPNLGGIWEALNTAHWDLQEHPAQSGRIVALGALGAIPA